MPGPISARTLYVMASLFKTTCVFSLNSGAEEARCSFHHLTPSAPPADLAGALSANVGDLWDLIKNRYRTTTTFVGFECVGIDLATGAQNTPTFPINYGVAGTDNGVQLPLQIAMVLTIRTGSVGGSGRGRMFLPPPTTSAMQSDGAIFADDRDEICDAWAGFFLAINSTTGWDLGVWSRTNLSFTTATSVDMGSVFDTMRSRRSALIENRHSAAV